MEQTLTFGEAVALQPAWVGIWLNVLLLGAFIAPLSLLIWRPSRVAGVVSLAASIASGISIQLLYGLMGYVKLIGLPHIIFWVPLVVYLVRQMRRADMPVWPRRIMILIIATICVSLVFDISDVIRYALGNRDSGV